jgi:hypothetical protein
MRPSGKPSGRIGLKVTSRCEKKYSYRSYNIDFKMTVPAYWNEATVDHTLKKFWPELVNPKDLETNEIFYILGRKIRIF